MAEIDLEIRCGDCGDTLQADVSMAQSSVEIEVAPCQRCVWKNQ